MFWSLTDTDEEWSNVWFRVLFKGAIRLINANVWLRQNCTPSLTHEYEPHCKETQGLKHKRAHIIDWNNTICISQINCPSAHQSLLARWARQDSDKIELQRQALSVRASDPYAMTSTHTDSTAVKSIGRPTSPARSSTWTSSICGSSSTSL